MRNFRTVFEFEFFQQIKKRVVIISTIILAIVAFGGAAAPAILNQFKKQTEFESSEGASYLNEYVPGGYYVPNEEIVKELRIEESSLYPTEDALKEAVKKQKVMQSMIMTTTKLISMIKGLQVVWIKH